MDTLSAPFIASPTPIAIATAASTSPTISGGPFGSWSAIAVPHSWGTMSSGQGAEGMIIGLANFLLSYATLIIGITAVFMLIIAGMRYITSGGDTDKAQKARATLIHAVIGIIIIVSAFSIVKFAIGLAGSLAAQ